MVLVLCGPNGFEAGREEFTAINHARTKFLYPYEVVGFVSCPFPPLVCGTRLCARSCFSRRCQSHAAFQLGRHPRSFIVHRILQPVRRTRAGHTESLAQIELIKETPFFWKRDESRRCSISGATTRDETWKGKVPPDSTTPTDVAMLCCKIVYMNMCAITRQPDQDRRQWTTGSAHDIPVRSFSV